MQGVEQCFPHSVQVTSKGFSKYLFHGEDTVWNQLSSCPHAAVLEIGEASEGLGDTPGPPGNDPPTPSLYGGPAWGTPRVPQQAARRSGLKCVSICKKRYVAALTARISVIESLQV